MKPNDPAKSSLNLLDSRANQFIHFRASDFRKDAGQSTVPFFDSQPIITEPAVPLSGIGLLHKGADGFGGFLALRAFTVDMAKQIKFDIPTDKMTTYKTIYTRAMATNSEELTDEFL